MTDSIERTLGRLEGKMDSVLESLREGREVMETLESRTAVLERWQSRVLGGALVAGFVSGIVAKVLL